MNKKLTKRYLILTTILILCTCSLGGCSNETDELTNNYQKIMEASNEFSKVKNGIFFYMQENPPFERTVEFVKTEDDIDWLKAEPDSKYSKYIGGKAYMKEGEQWAEVSKDGVTQPSELKQFTEIAQGDSKTAPKEILSIEVNELDDITEYEVHYDVKVLAKLNYDRAYESYIQENPRLSDDEIAEIWDNISTSNYELDSMIAKFGVDKNNVLVYINSSMGKDGNTFKQKTELTDYNIELSLQ